MDEFSKKHRLFMVLGKDWWLKSKILERSFSGIVLNNSAWFLKNWMPTNYEKKNDCAYQENNPKSIWRTVFKIFSYKIKFSKCLWIDQILLKISKKTVNFKLKIKFPTCLRCGPILFWQFWKIRKLLEVKINQGYFFRHFRPCLEKGQHFYLPENWTNSVFFCEGGEKSRRTSKSYFGRIE